MKILKHPRRSTKKIPWSETTPVVKSASMSSAPPGYVIPRTWFERALVDLDLWLICSGRVTLEDNQGNTLPLSRGAVILLRPGDLFELRVGPDTTYANAYVHFDLLDSTGRILPPDRLELPPTISHALDMPHFEATLRRIMYLQYQLQSADPTQASALRNLSAHLLKGLLQDLELSQQRPEIPEQNSLQKAHAQLASAALSWIYLHSNSRLSAAELAQKFGCSERHFGRIFRQACGRSPGQALIEARMDHAKKLLADSSMNVSEIASSLHYDTVFYFSRQFRKSTGLSPLQFRRRAQKNEDIFTK